MVGSNAARWALALVVGGSLASACGGESGRDSGGGSGANSGTAGKPTNGGSGNTMGGAAGRGGSGGTAGAGATSGTGGSSTTGGSGGSTGGNAGTAGGAGRKVCGGFVGATCAANEWCNFPDTLCGAADGSGFCELRPGDCNLDCPGVCGCDGKSYCNACIASGSGVDVAADGNCPGGDGAEGSVCGTDTDCGGNLRCCYPCGVPDCQNVCTDTGGGPCQPIP